MREQVLELVKEAVEDLNDELQYESLNAPPRKRRSSATMTASTRSRSSGLSLTSNSGCRRASTPRSA